MNSKLNLTETKAPERLQVLRVELEKGQRQMAMFDRQRGELRDTLLRISGAIQVLEELLQSEVSSNGCTGNTELESRITPIESAVEVSM